MAKDKSGIEIGASAEMEGDESQEEKKPVWKKWWFWLIVVIVILAIAGSVDDESEDATSTDSGSTAVEEEAVEEEAVEEEAVEEEAVEEEAVEEEAVEEEASYTLKAADPDFDIEFKEATEDGVTFTVTCTEDAVQLDMADARVEVDGDSFGVSYDEETDEYVSDFSVLVDGEDEGYLIYVEEGDTFDLTFCYPANPEFDKMVITYDCDVWGAGLATQTERYEYQDVTMTVSKD